MATDNGHIQYLQEIALRDVETVTAKDAEYGASWKKRGGTGAFMMLARKWDRLENGLQPVEEGVPTARLGSARKLDIPAYDIITAALLDNRSEGIIDDIRDLRAYLLLVEAEVMNRRAQQTAHSFSIVEEGSLRDKLIQPGDFIENKI